MLFATLCWLWAWNDFGPGPRCCIGDRNIQVFLQQVAFILEINGFLLFFWQDAGSDGPTDSRLFWGQQWSGERTGNDAIHWTRQARRERRERQRTVAPIYRPLYPTLDAENQPSAPPLTPTP